MVPRASAGTGPDRPPSHWWLPALFGALAALVFGRTVSLGFVWDDLVQIPRPEALGSFPFWCFVDNRWHPGFGAKNYYRPVHFITHWLDTAVWGFTPAGHHLTNVILFALLVAILVQVLIFLEIPTAGVVAAGLYFVFLPAHAETVAWVAGRPDLLAALFGSISWWITLKARTRLGHLLASGFLLLALLSKEVAIAFPLGLLLYRLAPPRGDRSVSAPPGDRNPGMLSRVSDVLWYAIPAGVLYLALRLACRQVRAGYPFGWPETGTEAILVCVVNIKLVGRYLGMLLVGADPGPAAYSELMVMLFHQGPKVSEMLAAQCDRELALAVVAIAGLLPWLWKLRRDPRVLLALGLAVPALLVSLNLTSARAQILFAERYVFVPSFGVAVLLGLLVGQQPGFLARIPSRARFLVALGISITWLSALWNRSSRYQDPITFWTAAVEANPASQTARTNLGFTLLNAGLPEEARHQLLWSFGLRPTAESLRNVIRLEVELGRHDSAMNLGQANPSLLGTPDTHRSLAVASLNRGFHAKALDHAQRAAGLAPKDAGILYIVGMSLAKLSRLPEARRVFEEVVRRSPRSPGAYAELARTHRSLGDAGAAQRVLDQARRQGLSVPDTAPVSPVNPSRRDTASSPWLSP
jgi:hypothetical protein